MKVKIIIPARYNSSRLPGKPLVDILGKPMIQHVYEKACDALSAEDVIIATDDIRISKVVAEFGGNAVLTAADHISGTDRLVEVSTLIDADIYINIQGDEPLIRVADIQLIIDAMISNSDIQVATLCHPIGAAESLNPNTVKLVADQNGDALYFSRSPIPYPRDSKSAKYLKHIGVYAYRKDVLSNYKMLANADIEHAEMLEQLRILYAGTKIRAFQVAPTGPGVDTPECLERVRAILSGQTLDSKPELQDVDLVITDVDGVLTNGYLYYTEQGESLKCFHARDGLGIRMLIEAGVHIAVISGRDSSVLRRRLADLGINNYRLGVKDKKSACIEIMTELSIKKNNVLTVGDDTIDLPAFSCCGLSVAVADAPEYIKSVADITLRTCGGDGAFRELSDMILESKGKRDVYAHPDVFLSHIKSIQQ